MSLRKVEQEEYYKFVESYKRPLQSWGENDMLEFFDGEKLVARQSGLSNPPCEYEIDREEPSRKASV